VRCEQALFVFGIKTEQSSSHRDDHPQRSFANRLLVVDGLAAAAPMGVTAFLDRHAKEKLRCDGPCQVVHRETHFLVSPGLFGGQTIPILPRLSGRRFELEDFGKRGPAPAGMTICPRNVQFARFIRIIGYIMRYSSLLEAHNRNHCAS